MSTVSTPSALKWRTRDGQVLSPEEMTTTHIQNCIRQLERRKESLYDAMPWDWGDGSDGTWGCAQSASVVVGVQLDSVEEAITAFQQELSRRTDQ